MSGPGMSLDMRVSQRLEQRQVLSLQTIQSLKILQMSTADLQELISDEMLENPTLEVAPNEDDAPTRIEREEEVHEQIRNEDPEPTTEVGETYAEVYEFLQKHTDIDDRPPRSAATPSDASEPDAKAEAFSQVPADGDDLTDHLLQQLRLSEFDELDWPLLEAVVHSLDSRGYLEYPLADIVKSLDGRYTLEEAEWALRVIQGLEPRGIGARNLAECLLLQVGEDDPDYPKLKVLLTEHWDDVVKNRLPRVAREMDIDIGELKVLIEILGTLNPHPGTLYSFEPTQVVTPDVIVEEDEETGRFKVRLTRENVPRLALSPSYLKMLEKKKNDRETLKFIKNKLKNARQLIDAIDQRQSTLERVANEIVQRQEGFLREGVSALKPMKMQDIADKLGIHHSTVWRSVYSKYMQTPQGVQAMNTFFTGGLPKDDGETSREAVKQKVQEIVDAESKSKPLSDMAISRKLADAGIQASRRVVTKYREELGIPDSRVRRRH